MAERNEYVINFPTLFVVADWIQAHCPVPDGFRQGSELELYDWQLWCTLNHYRVKPDAHVGQLAPAFHYRRSQIVAPQKTGKGPWSATIVCAEAAGPVVFAGWARGGERYRCSDHGCGCGWWYVYGAGEPMGMPWQTPLIQLVATSEAQVANVYRPLQNMIKLGPLAGQARVGEDFIRVGESGRIDSVTSSALSRLGNPITFAVQDESGLYTATNKMIRVAETQRRGLAGMGGRSMETTNAWDPTEESVAQRTAESKVKDVFRYHPLAPASLDYSVKAQRRRIHEIVYADSQHVDLDAIEAEVSEIMEADPGQAERFFGNRIVAGHGQWMQMGPWEQRADTERDIPAPSPYKLMRVPIVLGFDGSDVDDWTAIRAETMDGFQFTPTYGPDDRPTVWDPADWGGQVPRLEVDAAIDHLFRNYDVKLMYADPPYWETEVDTWADRYGEKKVIRWHTRRVIQMFDAAERLKNDVVKRDSTFTHDGCELTARHMLNTRMAARPSDRYVLAKPEQRRKIDLAVVSVLTHEAACDAIAAGLLKKKPRYGGA